MARYAQQTTVSVEKSQAEIARLLERYGAARFVSGWIEGAAVVGFSVRDIQIRFELPTPDLAEFRRYQHGDHVRERTEAQAQDACNQAKRQRWRALALVIKAKLEAVEAGITTFEAEFLANVETGDGRTVGDHFLPRLALLSKPGMRLDRMLEAHAS